MKPKEIEAVEKAINDLVPQARRDILLVEPGRDSIRKVHTRLEQLVRDTAKRLDAPPMTNWMSSLSEEEKRAVFELSAKQELSSLQVLRCALRDYQARVMGRPDLGVGGCMGE